MIRSWREYLAQYIDKHLKIIRSNAKRDKNKTNDKVGPHSQDKLYYMWNYKSFLKSTYLMLSALQEKDSSWRRLLTYSIHKSLIQHIKPRK